MQQAIGGTYLQALAIVQASITYWEEAGLIERLRHPDIDLIAFIHKTCGEFAAALYLSEMEPDEARETIMAALSNPDWNEVLDFATQTPLATILAEILVAEFDAAQPDLSTLNRLFRVLVRPETSLSPAERRSFLERVFTLARSEDRQKAYRVGRCLTELRPKPNAGSRRNGIRYRVGHDGVVAPRGLGGPRLPLSQQSPPKRPGRYLVPFHETEPRQRLLRPAGIETTVWTAPRPKRFRELHDRRA